MKNKLLKGLVFAGLALTAILTISLTSVSAESVFEEYSLDSYSLEYDVETTYSLEDMLTYAILDEYLAKAEYEAIIDTFGEVMPFVRIVEAEQTHIELLLPLFEAYDIEVPENNAVDFIVIPESITSALATGVEAEEANIAMYQLFLAQDNLSDDVRTVFEYLVNASENHLQAFSNDRYSYLGEDLMNQVKNQWRKAFSGSNSQGTGNQYKGSNGQGEGNQYKGSNSKSAENQLNQTKLYSGECQLD